MTHAAKSHDALEALQEMRDRIDAILKAEADKADKMERDLIMANAVALLTKLARQATVTSADKLAIKGVVEQLRRVA